MDIEKVKSLYPNAQNVHQEGPFTFLNLPEDIGDASAYKVDPNGGPAKVQGDVMEVIPVNLDPEMENPGAITEDTQMVYTGVKDIGSLQQTAKEENKTLENVLRDRYKESYAQVLKQSQHSAEESESTKQDMLDTLMDMARKQGLSLTKEQFQTDFEDIAEEAEEDAAYVDVEDIAEEAEEDAAYVDVGDLKGFNESSFNIKINKRKQELMETDPITVKLKLTETTSTMKCESVQKTDNHLLLFFNPDEPHTLPNEGTKPEITFNGNTHKCTFEGDIYDSLVPPYQVCMMNLVKEQ